MSVIKVKEVKPGLYSDVNDDKYFKSDKGTIFKQVDGVWHDCTEEGEADCPVGKDVEIQIVESEKFLKHIKLFESFLNESYFKFSDEKTAGEAHKILCDTILADSDSATLPVLFSAQRLLQCRFGK